MLHVAAFRCSEQVLDAAEVQELELDSEAEDEMELESPEDTTSGTSSGHSQEPVQAALGSCDGVVWRHRVRYEQTMSNTTVARRCHATRGENAQAVKPPFGSIWQVATSSLGMSILKLKCNHEQSITLIRHQVHQVLLALPRTAPLQFARIWTLHRDSALLKLRFLPEQRVLEVFLHLNVHSRSSSK